MVGNLARKLSPTQLPKISELPHDDIKWCTVTLNDVINAGKRLEASVFEIEGKHARENVENCKYPKSTLCGAEGIASAYTGARFKRIWLKHSENPIFQPSTIMDIKPEPDGYISSVTNTDINKLRVKKGQILITCSGTIGKISLVSKTLDNQIFSHDLIRMDVKNPADIGFVYAFLRSKTGNVLLQSNSYGAVITHIEPEHLTSLPIPNPPEPIKAKINDLIIKSFELRDESNELIDKATKLLIDELHLPSISELDTQKFDKAHEVDNFVVKLSEISGRLDGSYHVPIVKAIVEHLIKYADEVTTVGDSRVSKGIILAGVFKRVYVKKEHGIPFLGGKEITQLNPQVEKFLSKSHHKMRYEKELKIKENMILITDRGTIGEVAFVPKHFENWAVSQNVLKLVSVNDDISGYIFIFLNSKYGKVLMQQQTYGSVIDMIDNNSLARVPFPLLKNKAVQDEINSLALKANELRYEAYLAEQKALQIMDDEVIFAE